jgi:pyocin large subunit-like protein
MVLRQKYMLLSQQTFPYTTTKYLKKVFEKNNSNNESNQNEKETKDLDKRIEENGIIFEEMETNNHELLNKDDDFVSTKNVPNLNYTFQNENGVIHIYDDKSNETKFESIDYPNLKSFIEDYELLVAFISEGPL